MDTSTVVWIVVAAIAVIVLLAVVWRLASTKRAERNRAQAHELRERAAASATDLQRKEATAKESEAQAAAARAEAERKAAEAERLEAEARDRMNAAQAHRQEQQEHLRRADELDPDVEHAAPTVGEPAAEGRPASTEAALAPESGDGHTGGSSGGAHRRT